MDQLEDYVNAMLAQPDFITTSTYWNFYLVSSEYDDVVKQRITQTDRPVGLFLDKPNHKVWVKSWAELIRDCESRLNFVQEKLRIEISAEEIGERIAQLRSSILKVDDEQTLNMALRPGAADQEPEISRAPSHVSSPPP